MGLSTALHWILGAVAIVAMFLVLVVPHEAGHMALAKLFKVGVYEYAIGMGNKLWSFTRGGTVYALRAIPLGGYVRMAGMEEGDFDAVDSFHSRPAWQRLLILAAGPVVNFSLAAALMIAVSMTMLNSDPGKVLGVYQNLPAYAQGIRPADSIRSVNGQPMQRRDQIRTIEQQGHGKPLVLGVRRPDGSTFTATVTPRYDPQAKEYRIGVDVAAVVTPLDAIWAGIRFPIQTVVFIGTGLAALVTGPGGVSGLLGPSGVTGPVGIGYLTYTIANQGLLNWLQLAAVLSIALGLANLLPLPALDGGRMVVVLAEKLRGRPFDREREMVIQRAGLVALLALMVLILFLDVQRIATGQFPGQR
jgi:regulator of sigma E protease